MSRQNRNPDEIEAQKASFTGESEIHLELRRISRVLALSTIKGLQQNQQIIFLDSSGFNPSEIAEMVGTTRGVVHQTLYENRKARKRKKSKRPVASSKK